MLLLYNKTLIFTLYSLYVHPEGSVSSSILHHLVVRRIDPFSACLVCVYIKRLAKGRERINRSKIAETEKSVKQKD